MVILHDAIKAIQNGGFVFFFKNKTFFSKKRIKRNQEDCFLKKSFFLTLIIFNLFLWFSLDHTIWNKSRRYQFDWVYAAHLE